MNQAHDQQVSASIHSLLNKPSATDRQRVGKILATLQAIDYKCSAIHPRTAYLPKSLSAGISIPVWLKEWQARRFLCGFYTETDEWRLSARGPLTREARSEYQSNGYELADRFSALSVTPKQLKIHERPIQIQHTYIAADSAAGIPTLATSGKETLAIVPVAEAPANFNITQHINSLEFNLADGFDPAEILQQALTRIQFADIVLAPELIMPEEYAKQIPDKLQSFTPRPCHLLVAGSGPSIGQQYDKSWNQSSVFNGAGALLWQQQKVWIATLNGEQADTYGIKLNNSQHVHEHNAEGDTLVVADSDSLGRCLILICQDLKGQPLASEVIRYFQPDWVFVPILDKSLDEGRWVHQHCFLLSELSSARFVIANNLAFNSTRTCGMAIGPKTANSVDQGRQGQMQEGDAATPSIATFTWGEGEWSLTILGLQPSPTATN